MPFLDYLEKSFKLFFRARNWLFFIGAYGYLVWGFWAIQAIFLWT